MKQLTIWHFSDGKPGHQNQVLGLLDALQCHCDERKITVYARKFDVDGSKFKDVSSLCCGFQKRYPQMQSAVSDGRPDLILAAGSQTHISAYLAGRQFGREDGKTFALTLMKPSLPFVSFDLSIVPKHDGLNESDKVWITEGVLNHVRPSTRKLQDQGLMLIGGPSKHHDWSTLDMMGQILNVLGQNKHMTWRMTNSRRTPLETTKQLAEVKLEKVQFVPFEVTDRKWLEEVFATCQQIWVSEDSVSMVSESLTSGANVGLFAVPIKNKRSRVVQGLKHWVAQGLVTPYQTWLKSRQLNSVEMGLNEAERIGKRLFDLLVERFEL